jgi:pimeloyl-ACP methyl ester carboxylesterase
MRLVESLLSITNFLTLLVLALPLPRSVLWIRYLAPIALLIAVIQLLAEGWRWQMVPAYALSGLFLLAWLFQKTTTAGGFAEQILDNRVTTSLGFGLGVLGLVISITLPVILPVFRFPLPGGPYGIGTLTYHWVDASRAEVFSTDPNARRELMVQIWYPTRKGSSSQAAPYISDSDVVTAALARLHNFPGFSLEHLKYVRTHAVPSAPAAGQLPNYPVLIFLEGLTGYRQMNTFQVEELVSQGYIVVGIDQPGAAAMVVFPDGHEIAGLSKAEMEPLTQQSVSPSEKAPLLNGQEFRDGNIPYFAQDVSFALDQLDSINNTDPQGSLTGKLNMGQIGMFGVSFGGMVGAEACLKDPRIKACLVMDVVMPADVVQMGLQQPSMFITRPAGTMRLEREKSGGWTEQDIQQTQSTMRAVYDNLPGDGYFVQVPGMFHIDLTDDNTISPIFPMIGFSGPIGSQRAHDIINAYSLAFFDRHLKNLPETLLEGSSKQFRFAEVLFEARRP